jgi:hypothetical protein
MFEGLLDGVLGVFTVAQNAISDQEHPVLATLKQDAESSIGAAGGFPNELRVLVLCAAQDGAREQSFVYNLRSVCGCDSHSFPLSRIQRDCPCKDSNRCFM